VWGKDRSGRFRTHGRDSVTTVRGTKWSVADRCDGTVTRVTEGAVDVTVRRTGRVVRVDAGERFIARHRR
jgi:ferric-dicitrate binding protein FerR (iron transport regulator)